MIALLVVVVGSLLPLLTFAGPYDAVQYYYLVQFSDTQCTKPMGVTFMAVNKCFTQSLSTTVSTASDGVSTFMAGSGWAMATFKQPATGTTGTLVLTQYKDGLCTQSVDNSAITLSLPVASTGSPYGPYGTLSQCAASFQSASGTQNVYNQGGLYGFTNKLEMESALSLLSGGTSGPVYATFADSYCSMGNTVDGAGNQVRARKNPFPSGMNFFSKPRFPSIAIFFQLPIYASWAANGACTYSFLTDKFKTETCAAGAAVAGANAFSNAWVGYSDNACKNSLYGAGTSGSYGEPDQTFCTLSSDPAFPYASKQLVGPYTGGYCAAANGAPTKCVSRLSPHTLSPTSLPHPQLTPTPPLHRYVVLEQYYQDTTCANGPTAVNAVVLDTCVNAETAGQYKKATFAPGQTAFAAGVQTDSYGTLSITVYVDSACTVVASGPPVYTLKVPTGPAGMPSTKCNAVRASSAPTVCTRLPGMCFVFLACSPCHFPSPRLP